MSQREIKKRRHGRLIGFIPIFPLISILLLVLGKDLIAYWRKIPVILQIACAVFLSTQMVAALLTENMVVSVVLTALRSLIIVGLVIYGYRCSRFFDLRYFILSLIVISFLALFIATIDISANKIHFHFYKIFEKDLEFLYISSNSMSILGVILIWASIFEHTWKTWKRVGLVFLGVFVAFLGGGYSAWIALFVGILAGYSHRIIILIRAICITCVVGIFFFERLQQKIFVILGKVTNEREIFWEHAVHILNTHPWGGAGVYQYGALAAPFQESCKTLGTLETFFPYCPDWLVQLKQPWFIAHNGSLHIMAETGHIGAIGWFILLGVLCFGIWTSKWKFARATLCGMLFINLLDNTILIPSPGFSELLFCLSGAAWYRLSVRERHYQTPFQLPKSIIVGFLIGVSTYVFPFAVGFSPQQPKVHVNHYILPRMFNKNEIYAVYVDLKGVSENISINIEQCSEIMVCQKVGGVQINQRVYADWIYARVIGDDIGPEMTMRLVMTKQDRKGSRFIIKQWKVNNIDQ